MNKPLTAKQLQILATVHDTPVDWPAECARLAERVSDLETVLAGDDEPLAAERSAMTKRFGAGNYEVDVTYQSDGEATYRVSLICNPYTRGDAAPTIEAATINLLRAIEGRKRQDAAKAEELKNASAVDIAGAREELEHAAALKEQTV
jgi:hypothetical protein